MGMRFVKIFVIVSGILLVVGTVTLLTQISSHLPSFSSSNPEDEPIDTHVAIPAGGTIITTTPIGASGVVVTVKLAGGGGQLLMVNKKGQLMRRVHLEEKR
ncbi:MAG: hypothetical protein HQL69_08020 [Magnetococcales bacterium]|nr:hypothetical protein [Magnetococcales bacterium]